MKIKGLNYFRFKIMLSSYCNMEKFEVEVEIDGKVVASIIRSCRKKAEEYYKLLLMMDWNGEATIRLLDGNGEEIKNLKQLK